MALVQALFALVSRSLGKLVTAVFGWAVVALFGQTTDREKTWLSALVGAAVLWPLLVAGVAVPRAAVFLIAFVPMHAAIPDAVLRVVWIALAVAIPGAIGLVMAAKAPPGTASRPWWRRVLAGFPTTVALAASFLVTFVTVPVLRLTNLVRRREDASIPAITDAAAYHDTAADVIAMLIDHGLALDRAAPPAWVTLPSRILLWLGGAAFRGYVPEYLEFYRGEDVELTFYPSGIILRGRREPTLRAHALIAECLTRTSALQTTTPGAQALEREIHEVWSLFDRDPAGHAGSATLLARLDQLAADARRLDPSWDEWQVLYRELLQLGRALRGDEQLVDRADRRAEADGQPPAGLLQRAAWLARKALEV